MTKNIAGMNRMNKQVTREDVAREAGVSVAAVSRALNNSGYVKKEKKERTHFRVFVLGARGGSRTRTPLRALAPEASESTNSTTRALGGCFG